MDKLLIKNVHIIDPSQSLNCISDIMIEDGVISKLGKNLTVDCKTIDGSGLYAAPGLVKRVNGEDNSLFVGCSGFPKCRHTEPFKKEMGS